ncbi:unannotated protein [freshwater metagenome]|uniref:Unannotated protein n=1 Tax=freshwater metagenome TaxID=449393 RepID=A0A6J7LE79_9ZZZZ
MCWVVGLCDVLGVRLFKQIDATNVINVTLGREDVMSRPRANRIEHALMVRCFVPHAGVHDDSAVVGEDHVRRRRARRSVDEAVDDWVRRIVIDRSQQLFTRSGVNEMVDLLLDVHLTSICTGNVFM